MPRLRKFLCSCFGFLAFIFTSVSILTITRLVFEIRRGGLLPPIHTTRVSFPVALLIAVLARLVLIMPLALAVPCGMAWWKIKNGKASARRWAITASIAMIVLGLPTFVAAFYFWLHDTRGHGVQAVFMQGILVALGIAGLVAFARHDSLGQTPIIPAKPPRIAGDGTSSLLDTIAWTFACVGYFTCQFLWIRWASAQHLHFTRGLSFWLLFASAALIETAAHEFGHAAVGVALGMKLRAFIVGPFHWRVREGRWVFQFLPAKLLSGGGATGVVPTDPQHSRWNEIGMIAAGPLASLSTGLIALGVMLSSKGKPYEQYWEFFALMATFGLVSFAVNLIPIRPEGLYSDGARIYQLLRGGPWADYHRAISTVTATLVSQNRPRDYDIAALQRASIHFAAGRQALLLRLFAASCYFDRGSYPEASAALADAARIYNESASDVPAELHTAFIIKGVLLNRDAADARLWWDRMEAKKRERLNADYWLAKTALHWAENDSNAARDAFNTGNTLVQKLPDVGTYNYDRDCYSRMKYLLDGPPNVSAHAELCEGTYSLRP